MDCCYLDRGCDDYEVTPMLEPHCSGDDEPACYPRLPACEHASCKKPPKVVYCHEAKPPKVMYCCESKPPKVMYCCEQKPPKVVYCKPSSPCKHSPRSHHHSPRSHHHSPHSHHHSPHSHHHSPHSHHHSPHSHHHSPHSHHHSPHLHHRSPHSQHHSNTHSCQEREPCCKPVKTKYIIPCYRYEDGRIVRQLPVTAFKRNGMQDQEHSKLLGTANFLVRCPRDVSIECNACVNPVKVADPAKVPPCSSNPAARCGFIKKKPVEKNQTTVLMRRACEVACGARARRTPFVVSTYHADPDHEVRRFHAEDEQGNCCYHFERKKPECHEPAHICNPCVPTGTCVSSPGCEYVSALVAKRGSELSSCYYCR